MLKYLNIFITLLCTYTIANCNPDTIYYNSDWEITSSNFAKYYRISDFDVENLHFDKEINDFTIEGQKIMTGYYFEGEKDSLFTFYYNNNTVWLEIYFQKGKRSGIWREFYKNGELKTECYYKNDIEYICQVFDSLGRQIVKDGVGMFLDQRLYQPINEKYFMQGAVRDSLRTGTWIFLDKIANKILIETYDKGIFQNSKPNLRKTSFDVNFFAMEHFCIEIPKSLAQTENIRFQTGVKIKSNNLLKAFAKDNVVSRGIDEHSNTILGFQELEYFLDDKILLNSSEEFENVNDTVIIRFHHNKDYSIENIELIKSTNSDNLNIEIKNVLNSIDKIIISDELVLPKIINYLYVIKPVYLPPDLQN